MCLLPIALVATLMSGLGGDAGSIGGGDPKPHVEFDFATLPRSGDGTYRLTLTVRTTNKNLHFTQESKNDRKYAPEDLCECYAESLRDSRFKAEVVDKTKLRVYGRIFNDELIPAIQGRVESPDLKKEELPRVKNPKRL